MCSVQEKSASCETASKERVLTASLAKSNSIQSGYIAGSTFPNICSRLERYSDACRIPLANLNTSSCFTLVQCSQRNWLWLLVKKTNASVEIEFIYRYMIIFDHLLDDTIFIHPIRCD